MPYITPLERFAKDKERGRTEGRTDEMHPIIFCPNCLLGRGCMALQTTLIPQPDRPIAKTGCSRCARFSENK